MNDPAKFLDATQYVVEANSFEQMTLWSQFSDGSEFRYTCRGQDIGYKRHKWVQINEGHSVTVGYIKGFPVNISITWAYIDNILVMFYDSISRVVDYTMVREWLDKNTKCKDRHCNAQNFSVCRSYIQCPKNRIA